MVPLELHFNTQADLSICSRRLAAACRFSICVDQRNAHCWWFLCCLLPSRVGRTLRTSCDFWVPGSDRRFFHRVNRCDAGIRQRLA